MIKKPLVIVAAVLVLGEMPAGLSAQWMFDPSGFFYMKGNRPKGFEDFGYIALAPGAPRGPQASRSYLYSTTGVRYEFVRLNADWTPASKGRPFFEFATKARDGVSYTFEGRFLDNRVFATNVTDPDAAAAEGELVKSRSGRTIARAAVRLTYYARPWEKNDELMFSARRGDIAAVKALLAQGADAKAMGPYALSTLEYGVASGSADIVKALLAAGADVNAELSREAYERHPAFIADEGRTALMHAASKKDNLEIVELMLAAGADVNAKDWRRSTALKYAVFGSPEIVAALIRAKADVNAADDEGESLLMRMAGARAGEKVRLVGLLLAAGADVNAVDRKGETALMKWSAQADSSPILEALIRAGADVNARAKSQATALSIAESCGNESAARILKAAGAKK